MKVGSAVAKLGETVTIPVTVMGFSNVSSIQFTLQWDPTVLESVSTGAYALSGLSSENFGTAFTSDGKLTFSWDPPNSGGAALADGLAIFNVTFRVVAKNGVSTPVAIVDDPTVREVTVNSEAADFKSQEGTVLATSGENASSPKLTATHNGSMVVLEWSSECGG